MCTHMGGTSAMSAASNPTVAAATPMPTPQAPGMQGTPRQIAYAQSIRDEVEQNLSLSLPRNARNALIADVFPALTDSKLWINNAARIRTDLMKLGADIDDRTWAANASKTINWLMSEAIKANPALAAKYPRRTGNG